MRRNALLSKVALQKENLPTEHRCAEIDPCRYKGDIIIRVRYLYHQVARMDIAEENVFMSLYHHHPRSAHELHDLSGKGFLLCIIWAAKPIPNIWQIEEPRQ